MIKEGSNNLFSPNMFSRRNIDIGITVFAIILGIYLGWGNMEILIFGIFIWSILKPISSRYMAIPALFFLSITPFLLILERKEKAEEFAIYAYYFLVLAVIMGIYEIQKDKKELKNKTETRDKKI